MAVFYIGGSPCSGKSTIAGMLTTHYGLASYKLDDDLFAFMEKAARAGKPHSAADLALDFEQTWMRPPQLQAEGEFAIYEEIFPYAMAAIAARESEQTLIAEGAGFLPRLLAQQGVDKSHYICLVPTEAFQRENYAGVPGSGSFSPAAKTRTPPSTTGCAATPFLPGRFCARPRHWVTPP